LEPKVERKAGFIPAVTYAPSRSSPATRFAEGVPRGRPASPALCSAERRRWS